MATVIFGLIMFPTDRVERLQMRQRGAGYAPQSWIGDWYDGDN
jgi:hypothetical protein